MHVLTRASSRSAEVFWCPIGLPHDWSVCVYAHNYQDARRNPAIGYCATASAASGTQLQEEVTKSIPASKIHHEKIHHKFTTQNKLWVT